MLKCGYGARIGFWVLQSKSDLQSDNEGGIKKNGPAKKNGENPRFFMIICTFGAKNTPEIAFWNSPLVFLCLVFLQKYVYVFVLFFNEKRYDFSHE